MTTLGIIGSGNIGTAVARLAVDSGMDVVVANSRGPESLRGLVAELGAHARAGTVEDAARADAVLLSIPLLAVKDLPEGLLHDKLVLDTSNYYPSRDGRIPELDSGTMTTSQLVNTWLGGARQVKAFNNILAHHIPELARRAGDPDRSTLPVASDDPEAITEAAAILDRLGFDVFDAGSLADSWRFEPESAGYTPIYLADPATPREELMSAPAGPTSRGDVETALASATRVNVSERVY